MTEWVQRQPAWLLAVVVLAAIGAVGAAAATTGSAALWAFAGPAAWFNYEFVAKRFIDGGTASS